MIYTAQELLNYMNAGLVLFGQDEDGELEWAGKRENWIAHGWLEDGVSEQPFEDAVICRSLPRQILAS